MTEWLFVPAVAAGGLLALLLAILTKRHSFFKDPGWSGQAFAGIASSTTFTMLGMSSLVKGSAGLCCLVGCVSLATSSCVHLRFLGGIASVAVMTLVASRRC